MPNDARIRITRVINDEELGRQIEERMIRLGNAIGARAQRLVPKRTWALHDTISTTTERTGSRVVTTVGAGGGDVDYALNVERGTSRMRAQPYLRPALLQMKPGDFRYSGNGPETRGVKRDRAKTARERRKARAARPAPSTSKKRRKKK